MDVSKLKIISRVENYISLFRFEINSYFQTSMYYPPFIQFDTSHLTVLIEFNSQPNFYVRRYKFSAIGSLNSSLLLEGNCTLLNELYKWLGSRTQWCLCYGAFQRDWDVTKFHAKCDNKSHTVTIVRSTNGDIVGGYSDIPWSAKGNI